MRFVNPKRGSVTSFTSSRARRIFGGWSANVAGLLLALTQQIVLIPLFLKYWSGETLAAWLAIFAAGMLVLTLDAGLHPWSLNRFLQFRPRADCDRRTDRFYGAMLRLYAVYSALLIVALLAILTVVTPSRVFGFSFEPRFDLSFAIMALGMVVMIPSNLVTALYRARGLYGRIGALQALGLAIGQVGQIIGIVTTGSLLVVTSAFVAGQVAVAVFLILIDVRRQFPFLGRERGGISLRWSFAQLAGALPFSVTNFVELGLSYLSVLLIGFFVSDRIAIAQWSLTRTIVNLLRQVSYQTTLPLAAELGHDHAIGARDSLQRLYVRGSVILVLVAAAATSGALAFWPDFFAIWTHGAVPYDATLTVALLIGTCVATPALLAMSYASYSNRGPLLLRAKSAQLVLFVVLALLLIPRSGPLGAAIAMIASELIAQSAFLAVVIVGETLQRPVRYALMLAAMMTLIVAAGAALGETIGRLVPGSGLVHFVAECAIWLAVVTLVAAPMLRAQLRERLLALLSRV
jgi:O-antigen/teichoic acid export membrane protein